MIGMPTERLLAAIVTATVVLLGTRLLALAVAAGLLVATWHRLLDDEPARHDRRRLEAIATWLDDLRDTLRGSAVGVEEALDRVAARPPDAIADDLAAYLRRRGQGVRVEDALAELADDLAHPTADGAIAALRLVAGGTAGAGRLHPTVSALALAARDEVRARERIDRTRAIYRSSMQRLIVIAVALVLYLTVAAGDLLDPYATPAGQIFLAAPLALWAGCVLWLRSLCHFETPQRYRIVGSGTSTEMAP
jgi:tight adherence protein B